MMIIIAHNIYVLASVPANIEIKSAMFWNLTLCCRIGMNVAMHEFHFKLHESPQNQEHMKGRSVHLEFIKTQISLVILNMQT